MAIDPNIILQAGRGIPQLDIGGSMLQGQQIAANRDAAQQRQMTMRQMQQAEQEQQDLKGSYAFDPSGNVDAPATLRNLAQVNPQMAMKFGQQMQSNQLATNKAQAEQQKVAIDKHLAWGKQVSQTLYGVKDEETWQRAKQSLTELARLNGADTSQNTMPANYDPGWVAQHIKEGMTMEQQLAKAKAELEGNAMGAPHTMTDLKTGKEVSVQQRGKSGEMVPVKGFGPAKKAPGITIGGGGESGLTPEAMDLMVEQFRKTGVLPAVGQGKAGTQLRIALVNGAAAKDKAEGTVTDLAEAKKSFKTQTDAVKYFTTGAGANAMRQQETILHHAQVFQGIADALKNGDNQLVNRLGNEIGVQFGSDKATNLKMAGQIFSAEVGKYLAGSMGSAQEREELAKLMPMYNSPEQFKGGLKTLANLVEGQRKSWITQRDAALRGKVPGTEPEQGKPKWVRNKAEYDALPSGAPYMAKDGTIGRKP